jgi:hypothetical protein
MSYGAICAFATSRRQATNLTTCLILLSAYWDRRRRAGTSAACVGGDSARQHRSHASQLTATESWLVRLSDSVFRAWRCDGRTSHASSRLASHFCPGSVMVCGSRRSAGDSSSGRGAIGEARESWMSVRRSPPGASPTRDSGRHFPALEWSSPVRAGRDTRAYRCPSSIDPTLSGTSGQVLLSWQRSRHRTGWCDFPDARAKRCSQSPRQRRWLPTGRARSTRRWRPLGPVIAPRTDLAMVSGWQP